MLKTNRNPLFRVKLIALLGVLIFISFNGSGALAGETKFTTQFPLSGCDFTTEVENPYFPLQPGHRLILEGEKRRETITLDITVLDETRNITLKIGDESRNIETRVIEERKYRDGELVEVSRNFFAGCEKTNDIYYFGREVDLYEYGEVVKEGTNAWIAGERGARPGLMMPGIFILGSRYYQALALPVAMERAENIETGFNLTTPTGEFENCVRIRETSDLGRSKGIKTYCPDIGLIQDGYLKIIDFTVAESQ